MEKILIRDGKIRMRDPGWKYSDPGSGMGNFGSVTGINIPDPQHWFSDGKFGIRGQDKHPGSATLPVLTLNKRSSSACR
jgi:hypothetical protein